MYISSRFFENQPNEICSHLSEKASKGRLLGPDKLQNHSIKRKGERKRARRKKGGEETKKPMGALSVSLMATLRIVSGRKKNNNCWTQKVHLVVTFSNIRLDTSSETQGREKRQDASFQV